MLLIGPIDSDQQHRFPPPTRMRGHHARHHQQPSIRPAFETRLLIGGHLPRHPWGGMVLTWRSSREDRLILSPEVATRKICLVRANYNIEGPLSRDMHLRLLAERCGVALATLQ